jgi:hypothetical protein
MRGSGGGGRGRRSIEPSTLDRVKTCWFLVLVLAPWCLSENDDTSLSLYLERTISTKKAGYSRGKQRIDRLGSVGGAGEGWVRRCRGERGDTADKEEGGLQCIGEGIGGVVT